MDEENPGDTPRDTGAGEQFVVTGERQGVNPAGWSNLNYFPFTVKETRLSPSGNRTVINLDAAHVFLTAYSESFEATWETPTIPFGRLNPDCRYVQTTRRLAISFKLVAKNVDESRRNLDFCEYLSRRVYGQYTQTGIIPGEDDTARPIYRYEGATISNKVKFGNLIRDELAYFQAYSFRPNIDAGIFEYSDTPVNTQETLGQLQDRLGENENAELRERSWVYHSKKGKILPKVIEVDLTLVILHDYPLGFGGSRRRRSHALRWAENKNRDWPHGTGKTYPVNSIMQESSKPPPANSNILQLSNVLELDQPQDTGVVQFDLDFEGDVGDLTPEQLESLEAYNQPLGDEVGTADIGDIEDVSSSDPEELEAFGGDVWDVDDPMSSRTGGPRPPPDPTPRLEDNR